MKNQRVSLTPSPMSRERRVKRRSTDLLETGSVELPHNHPSKKCFNSYSKVEDYIKHMNNQFSITMNHAHRYDSAQDFMRFFQDKQPRPNSPIKPSYFPKSQITKELTNKINLLYAYYNIGTASSFKGRSSQRAASRTKQKRSNRRALGYQYYGFFNKLDKEYNKMYESMYNQETDKNFDKSFDKSFQMKSFSRKDTKSVEPVFLSQVENAKMSVSPRKKKFNRSCKAKPLEQLITVAKLDIKHRPRASIK